jgi:hypothetical protein
MANGSGSKLGGKANFQTGEYIFKMDYATASSHSLDMGDSGKTYLVDSTVVRTISLPSPKAGVSYKFVVTDSTAVSTLAATGALFKGSVVADNDSDSMAGTTISFTADLVVGDHLELVSDGTYWYVSGHTAHATGFTVA